MSKDIRYEIYDVRTNTVDNTKYDTNCNIFYHYIIILYSETLVQSTPRESKILNTVVLCTVNSLTFVEVWRHPSSTECTRGMNK
jgi:hypothetical protein